MRTRRIFRSILGIPFRAAGRNEPGAAATHRLTPSPLPAQIRAHPRSGPPKAGGPGTGVGGGSALRRAPFPSTHWLLTVCSVVNIAAAAVTRSLPAFFPRSPPPHPPRAPARAPVPLSRARRPPPPPRRHNRPGANSSHQLSDRSGGAASCARWASRRASRRPRRAASGSGLELREAAGELVLLRRRLGNLVPCALPAPAAHYSFPPPSRRSLRKDRNKVAPIGYFSTASRWGPICRQTQAPYLSACVRMRPTHRIRQITLQCEAVLLRHLPSWRAGVNTCC